MEGMNKIVSSSLLSQRGVCSGRVWGDYAVNVCGLLELLVQKSGPFFLSLWSFCLFLHPCFNLRGSHLQEEEVAESGVSGSLCTLGSCSARGVVFLPALFSDALFLFAFVCFCFCFSLPLTLLLYQNFRLQTDFRFNLLGLSWSQVHKSCEMIDDYSGKRRPDTFLVCQKDDILI